MNKLNLAVGAGILLLITALFGKDEPETEAKATPEQKANRKLTFQKQVIE